MTTDQDNKLTKYVSPLCAWALAFGCTVGWGAFVMPGSTFLPTAGPMGTIIGMSMGTVLMLLISFNYHYLMNRHGGTGGAFTYTTAAFGYDHGFLCAWFLVLTYIAILWANATALVLIARNLAGDVLQFGFHYKVTGYDVYLGETLVSVGAILFFGLICIRNKFLTAAIQTVMGVILILGIIFCLSAAIIKSGGSGFNQPWFARGEKPWVQVIQVAALVPWAFVGFESVSHSTGEFKFSPKKSFVIMFLAVIAAGVAYTFLTWLAVCVQPEGYSTWIPYIKDIGQMDGLKALPVFFVTREIMGMIGLVILTITSLAAMITGIVGNYIAVSRLFYALAGEGILSKRFHVIGRYNTPQKCILFIMAVSVFIPFLGRTTIGSIVDVTSVGAMIAYGYTSAAAFRHARLEKNNGVQVLGILGVIISIGFFMFAIIPNLWSISTLSADSYLLLTVWGVLGLAFFHGVVVRDNVQRFGKSMIVWIAMLLLLFFVSAIWMRQEIHNDMKVIVNNIAAYKMISASLLKNNLIQMGLCIVSLVILFSIFSIRNKRENLLEVAKVQAEKANATKSEFLASMSHEIRTPINAVLGMNEMIIRESKDDRITTYARNVESAGKNLLSIINDILDFSKIEAGKMEIVESNYQFSSVLNDVTNMIVFKAKHKGLKFNIHVDETLPDELLGDEVRVRQVVINILNNAVKYTDEGSVTFYVNGERKGEFINLTFVVQDTGIGIKPEDLPKLFGKFQRVDLVKNSTVEGTGLGLSITKNLLAMMNGDIKVESEYGEGSTFTITIPQKIISDNPIGNFQEKFNQYIHQMKAYKESFKAPSARILVVDDTEMNLTVVEGLLSKTEVQLDMVLSGMEALALTQSTPYDLILMDQRMPKMDGIQAMKHIRQQTDGVNCDTPIICLTADAVSGAKAKYIEQGFTDYLSKPIESNAIEAALIKYLPVQKVILQKELPQTVSEEPTPTDKTELENFYDKAEGLNYKDAIRFCMNEELLKKTLEQFYKSITPNANAIENFLLEKDYKNYTIKVHALKSSARLIGAGKLSDDALYLEERGNSMTEEDIEQLEQRTPKLLSDYRELINILSPLYASQENERESAPEIPLSELTAAYDAIREFASNFDIDAIDGIIAEVRKYRIPLNESEHFTTIEEAARNMDWGKLEDALK